MNTLTVRGTEKERDEFIAKHIIDDEFDFDTVIPEPRTIEECPKEFIRKGGEPIETLEDRPWFNWYDWSVANWGTKWNASCTHVEERRGKTIISFDTPWSAPEPIFYALREMHPNLDIECECDFEDGDGTIRF